MIQIVKCEKCKKTFAACHEPICYTDSYWIKNVHEYKLKGYIVQMIKSIEDMKIEKCVCYEKNKLQKNYEISCYEYLDQFCKKQDLNIDEFKWLNNIVGGVAYNSSYYFNFNDIVWDINSEQPKGKIINWYYDKYKTPVDNLSGYFDYSKIT